METVPTALDLEQDVEFPGGYSKEDFCLDVIICPVPAREVVSPARNSATRVRCASQFLVICLGSGHLPAARGMMLQNERLRSFPTELVLLGRALPT